MEEINKAFISYSGYKDLKDRLNNLDTILIVDDDPVTCFLQLKLINEMGYKGRLKEAYHAEGALSYLREIRPAGATSGEAEHMLLLLDIKMPFVDGFEFLERLSAAQDINKENLHISFLTTSMSRRDFERASSFSIVDFLIKPLTEQKLNHLLDAIDLC
ncbi:response regulator containing a CheY-like receiver domain and an HD-GYP domain [Flammeovirgaceae bacterium 311]|nr:response regulator containing a CheY-like receiver domain and an HD-GYP domain [Flammeovirgaceae bacterium 311]